MYFLMNYKVPLIVTQTNILLNDVAQNEENVSLIAVCVKDVNIRRINDIQITEKVSRSFEVMIVKDLILENTVPSKE